MAVTFWGTYFGVQLSHTLCIYSHFATKPTCTKPHSGFSLSLACHVAFLFPRPRSLRGNRCCLFIIQGLNGTTMKICHSLSVMIALFHYRPSAGGSQVESSTSIGTFLFLFPASCFWSWIFNWPISNLLFAVVPVCHPLHLFRRYCFKNRH